MLRELVQLFENRFGADPEAWLEPVLSKYQLKEGLYVKLSIDGFNEERDCLIVSKSYYRNNYPDNDTLHDWFVKRDFSSSLVDMNKPVRHVPSKKIHSNNILTFFCKKDELENAVCAYGSYCESLKNLELSKQERKLLSSDQLSWLESDERKSFSESCCKVIQNFLNLNDSVLKDLIVKNEIKNYIKLFLDFDTLDYFRESDLYIALKIFNDNKYCKEIEDVLFGIHGFNFGLNAKKPYLKSLANNDEAPFYVDQSFVRKIRLFFMWLYYQQNELGEKSLLQFSYRYDFLSSSSDKGNYFLNKVKGKYAVIEDYDNVPMRPSLKFKFSYHNCLDLKNDVSCTLSLSELERLVSSLFFNNMLKYHEEPFKGLSPTVKNIIYLTRTNLENIFEKHVFENSILIDLRRVLGQHYKNLLLDRLRENDFYWERNGKLVNLLLSIQGEEVVSNICEVKNTFRRMIVEINQGARSELVCESDIFYFFVAGQCVHFLLSKSKQTNKMHDLLLPFIQISSVKQLKLLLRTYFKKYSHELFLNNLRVNLTLEMLLSYDPCVQSTKGLEDVFMAGYFADNSLFIRKEKEDWVC